VKSATPTDTSRPRLKVAGIIHKVPGLSVLMRLQSFRYIDSLSQLAIPNYAGWRALHINCVLVPSTVEPSSRTERPSQEIPRMAIRPNRFTGPLLLISPHGRQQATSGPCSSSEQVVYFMGSYCAQIVRIVTSHLALFGNPKTPYLYLSLQVS
jgi:hypothetical protein